MRQARAEEIAYFRKMKVYTKVSIEECKRVTGKMPIGVRWVDVNKEDELNPKYRSRFVAKEINHKPMPEMYAATPPLEALRAVIGCAVNRSLWSKDSAVHIMITDVSRAYFYAKAIRPVYVRLAPEDCLPGEENVCGRLN